MPSGQQYLFCIQDNNYAFWQEDGAGNVTINHQPYFLKFSPDGWDNFSLKNERNKNYWGVDRSVSVPFSYVEDGAHIIKNVLYKYGIIENLYLGILKLQVEYNLAPVGAVSTTTLISGDNTGTITGPPNTTVYLKVTVTGTPFSDNISGQLSSSVFLGQFAGEGTKIYAIPLGNSGSETFNVFFDNGGSATATFQISDVNGNTEASYQYWYKQIYRGQIDLSEFVHDGSKVTCTTLEDGLAKYLKANENTVYELPMNVPEAVMIKMDGINLHNTSTYTTLDLEEGGGGIVGFKELATLPIFLSGQNGDGYGLTYITVNPEQISNNNADEDGWMANSENYAVSNDGSTPVVVHFPVGSHLDFNCIVNNSSLGGPGMMDAYFKVSSGAKFYITQNNSLGTGASYSIPFTFDITLQPGEKLFAMRLFHQGSGFTNMLIEYLETTSVQVSAITRRPPTYIRGLRPQYVFEQLVNLFTQGKFTGDLSNYFELNKQIVWTCGNAIRGFDTAVLKISISLFYQFFNSYDAVGMSENGNQVIFDSKQNLIDLIDVIQLPEPANFKTSFDKDYFFNQLNIGYPPISTDVGALNGNEEFNCGYSFTLGTTIAPAVLDKTSKTSASCYEIEKIRTTAIDTTTDYSTDNNNYVIYIDSVLQNDITPNYYLLDRSLNATATGLIERLTVFNLRLSPKRMLLNNLPYMSSAMFLSLLTLQYTTAEKNNKVICDGIVEKDNVPLDPSLRFFTPMVLTGDFPAPYDLESLLDVKPLSVFQFPVDGIIYSGILNSINSGSDANVSQTYEFLGLPTNDLLSLINFTG